MDILTLILAGTLAVIRVPDWLVDLFEAKEHRYTAGQFHDEPFRYRLFVPRKMKPTERYPLIVWLHGAGPSGKDNWSQLDLLDMVFDQPDRAEQYRFFLLAFQCPSADLGWYRQFEAANSNVHDANDMLTVNIDLLRKIMKEYPIDPDRVYLAGACTGGAASWEMAMRYPKLFAAVVPLGATGRIDPSRASRLTDVPIWTFHSLHDDLSPSGPVEDMVTAIKQSGGNIHLTLVPTGNHTCWIEAIQSHDAFAWMQAQRRGDPCWTPPGCQPWTWWRILVLPIALLAFIRLTWTVEHRWRRRREKIAGINEADFILNSSADHEGAL